MKDDRDFRAVDMLFRPKLRRFHSSTSRPAERGPAAARITCAGTFSVESADAPPAAIAESAQASPGMTAATARCLSFPPRCHSIT
jgi:hypothetical protein